ncbi:ethanolamine utilization protein EutQ [Microdochium nivale]|nr:ethanolamine utilization protein EutQ [Microdochium nivale]
MVFETRPKADIFKVDLTPGTNHVFYSEIFGSPKDASIKNPCTAAYLRIEKGPPVSPPRYDFDEAGILLEGEIDFEDEAGNKKTLTPGETFIIRRGSVMTVSSKSYGLIFKVEGAFMGNDIPLQIHDTPPASGI